MHEASWTPGAQKTPASKKSDSFSPPNRLLVPQAPDTLVRGLACDLLLTPGKPRDAPAGRWRGWAWPRQGAPGNAGRHGTMTGIRGPWPVRPLPGCGQREADALLARSSCAAVEEARPRRRRPRPRRWATHGVGGEEPW